MDEMVRLVLTVEPSLIQVCGFPSRTRLSISMKCTHAFVTGFLISIRLPAANPLESATVKDLAPEGTYLSAMTVLVFDSVADDLFLIFPNHDG